jgi:hypothetical protein
VQIFSRFVAVVVVALPVGGLRMFVDDYEGEAAGRLTHQELIASIKEAHASSFAVAYLEGLRKQPSPSVWLLLAMAQHRCQRKDQAKQWLSKARDWIAKARNAKPRGEGTDELSWKRLPWAEQLALEMLEREAGHLIEGELPKK